jgi:hypothetical protein
VAESEHEREREIGRRRQRRSQRDERAEDEPGQDIEQIDPGKAWQPQRNRGTHHKRDPEQRQRGLRARSPLAAQDSEREEGQNVLERSQRVQKPRVEVAHALDAGMGVCRGRQQREANRSACGGCTAPQALSRPVSPQGP